MSAIYPYIATLLIGFIIGLAFKINWLMGVIPMRDPVEVSDNEECDRAVMAVDEIINNNPIK